MKKLCSETDCYGEVDTGDVVQMPNGQPHVASLKCERCLTDAERKQLKAYKKRLRHAYNKKIRASTHPHLPDTNK